MNQRVVSVSRTEPDGLPRIADALAVAGPGATIVLQPGVYREELRLIGDVTLTAEDGPGTVTLRAPDGVAVFVGGGAVTLRGITIAGGSDTYPAIQVSGGELTMVDCELRADGLVGLHVRGSHVEVRNCVVESRSGAGLLLEQGMTGTFRSSTVRDCGGPGIVIATGADPQLIDCVVTGGQGPGVLSTRDGRGSLVDCDLSAVAGPAVAVEEGGMVHLRRTTIHDGDGPGIVATGGAPVFEDCLVRDVGGHGVVIAGDADPTLARCRIEGTGGHAVFALGNGTGRLVDCRFAESAVAVLAFTDTATSTLDKCVVEGAGDVAALFDGTAGGTLVRCEVRGGRTGVLVRGGADPLIEETLIAGCVEYGVQSIDGARGTVRNCTVEDYGVAGVRVTGARLAVTDSRLRGGRHGLVVAAGGHATVDACEIGAASVAGVLVEPAGELQLRRSRVRGGAAAGVRFAAGSRGTLSRSEVFDNGGDGVLLETAE
ncbi:right-handed parallel beta-helix repeat-containing protein, partial [Dactylosporangium sp. NPDC005555]|uniref:right-handed parallel beta-helix repeat-containing protein n=1 Tax=Dactylosporangium sp. NPDC005555 TaxID=3154889 RepID=UPI0033AC3CF2